MTPAIDPPIHPQVGVFPQIKKLQTELNYLNEVKIYLIFSKLTWPQPLTNPSTQPTIHPLRDGGISTNHKSLNRIKLSSKDQDLFDF